MVRASTFLLNIVWAFLCIHKKARFVSFFFFFLPVGSFSSRSECEKRKALWDACVAETKQDLGRMNNFDTQMLALMNTVGQYT
jgi:hypothetical protein